MSIVNKIKQFFGGQKSISLDRVYQDPYSGYDFFFGNDDIKKAFLNKLNNISDEAFHVFLSEAYGSNNHVYKTINKIVDMGVGLPTVIRDANGEPIEGPEVDAFRAWLNSNKRLYNFDALIEKAVTSYLVTGNSLVYAGSITGYDEGLDIEDTMPYCAHMPDITIGTAGLEGTMPIFYTVDSFSSTSGLTTQVPAMYACHTKKPNTIRVSDYGLSPLYPSRAVWMASNDGFTASASIHKNMGVAGVLSNKDANMPITSKEQQQLQRDFERRNAGASNFGKINVTTAAMQYTPIGMNSVDMQLLDSNREWLRYIASIYGIDSSLVNDPEHSTYNNRETAEKAAYMDVVVPTFNKVYNDIVQTFLPMFYAVPAISPALDATMTINEKAIPALNQPNAVLSDKILKEVAAKVITPEQAFGILYPESDMIFQATQNQNNES